MLNWHSLQLRRFTDLLSERRRRGLFVLLLVFGLTSPATLHAQKGLLPHAPGDAQLPSFTDDGQRTPLLTAANRHKHYLAGLSENTVTRINGDRYSKKELIGSLSAFLRLVNEEKEPEEFARRLREEFDVVQAAGRKDRKGKMLVTGYFEPLFAGSLTPTPTYRYPLYRLPQSLTVVRKKNDGRKMVRRRKGDGVLAPFWTRAEIDGPARPLAGNELAYLRDPFDAFLLHIQGSGRVELPDGSQLPVRFAGHNGHGYRSIGRVLVDEGKMELERTSIPAIRRYLREHPADVQRVLNENPRYIFFHIGDDASPKGSLGLPLTPGRSIAIDHHALPDTLFGWLETSVPVVNEKGQIVDWKTSRRFVLPQDSGSAIQGPGRVDLFWGSGRQAAVAAGNMRQEGRLFFFIKKRTQPVPSIKARRAKMYP